jgi:hypothetical protein
MLVYKRKKKCNVHVFSLFGGKLVKKNYGEPLKYVLQTLYKFEKLVFLVFWI